MAREVGLADADHPVDGHVFARIEPEGKLRLVTGGREQARSWR